MKFSALFAPFICALAARGEDVSTAEDLKYVPAVLVQDTTFIDKVLSDPLAQATLDTLGARSTALALSMSQQDWPTRKNMLNHLRHRAILIVQTWCEPSHNWLCTRKLRDEALNFIDTRFCSVYSHEMAQETCFPEAAGDFNRARLARLPPFSF